jgi:AtzE family amidohydrolase
MTDVENGAEPGVRDIVERISSGKTTAVATTRAALARVDALNPRINAFTAITRERALAEAAEVDARRAAGRDPGPLAGVPYGVKNLFDLAGLPTISGSRIDAERPAAARDATLVERLARAGAVCLGALNMDEYAFGFSTQNHHYGPTRNPHALDRVAGGSSGGSAAAVAARMVPLTLGSDTNGSIRVPAALCGVFGFKPTYGRLPRTGARLFAGSFDHVGPLARSVADIAATYDALQGPDDADPACAHRPGEPVSPHLGRGAEGLRIALADGFDASAVPEAWAAAERVASALGVRRRIKLPEVARARAAATIMTAAEGAELHLSDLAARAADFDPITRGLFLSGALVPAVWYVRAQRFRRWYCAEVCRLFGDVDVLLAPATPYPAFRIGESEVELDGEGVNASAHLGVFSQPLSFAGLPTLAAPVAGGGPLPLGVQVFAARWREDLVLRVAAEAEAARALLAPAAPAHNEVA